MIMNQLVNNIWTPTTFLTSNWISISQHRKYAYGPNYVLELCEIQVKEFLSFEVKPIRVEDCDIK